MTDNLGLYLHIPFCEKKCRYCDFYSSFLSEELLDSYTEALIGELKKWGGLNSRPIDTVYFGGGTPSLLAHRLPIITETVKTHFNLQKGSEITLELNPSGESEKLLYYAKEAGINRLSIGAQSGNDHELKLLGRTHTAKDTEKTVNLARKSGFDNISLDIMIALPDSNEASLKNSLEFIDSFSPEHISSYILKIEEKTALWAERENLNLPSEDETANQYLFMSSFFQNKGYSHYEISNFSKDGYESRHNLKYWQCDDYLGIGPSAHSFLNGKRFYYPKDLKGFIKGISPIDDGVGGNEEEYIMLSLRIKSGISFDEYEKRYNKKLPKSILDKCRLFEKAELLEMTDSNISLTDSGMLLSNSIITELLECIE